MSCRARLLEGGRETVVERGDPEAELLPPTCRVLAEGEDPGARERVEPTEREYEVGGRLDSADCS